MSIAVIACGYKGRPLGFKKLKVAARLEFRRSVAPQRDSDPAAQPGRATGPVREPGTGMLRGEMAKPKAHVRTPFCVIGLRPARAVSAGPAPDIRAERGFVASREHPR